MHPADFVESTIQLFYPEQCIGPHTGMLVRSSTYAALYIQKNSGSLSLPVAYPEVHYCITHVLIDVLPSTPFIYRACLSN